MSGRSASGVAFASACLVVTALALASASVVPSAEVADRDGNVRASAAGLALEFYDFFGVPFGEWWDDRMRVYGDLPIGAECFNATAVVGGVCTPTNPGVRDVAAYPYTAWHPSTGALDPSNPNAVPLVYAPYRLRAAGTAIPGYTLSQPVMLPVLSPTSPAGGRLDVDWRFQYLDRAGATALRDAGCPVSAQSLDGFVGRSRISLTLDLAESRRIFAVVATDATQAQEWWRQNTDPSCVGHGAAEQSVQGWFVAMGGSPSTVGVYDIANAFGYFYTPFYTQIGATVEASGLTRVTIDHVAWGTEVLLGRMFYWGSAAYRDHYLDSTRAAGWLRMEAGWLEDLSFQGTFRSDGVDLALTSAVQYHFQHLAGPGGDGRFDRAGDTPAWTWGPSLADRTRDRFAGHAASELKRYPNPPYTYVHTTPGSRQYGSSLAYDSAPIRWDLPSGEAWTFRFPTGDVAFYDPNTTPLGADPRSGGYAVRTAAVDLDRTRPADFGTWDAAAKTWAVVGPAATGGPEGSPGPDGTPGTADDRYAVEPWGAIVLRPAEGPALLRATTNPAVHGKILVDGVPRDEWGLAWMKIAPGLHTVSFGDVYGTSTPDAATVSLLSGRTTSVVGTYVVHGSLRVTTEPAVPATVYVNGAPSNDWGVWRSVAPGSYAVSFGAVAGYDPPAPQTVAIGPGEFRHVIGRFTANPSAPGPDPSGFGFLRVTTNPAVHSQILVDGVPRDEWGLAWVKVPPGDHTISFKGVYGFTTPPPTTVRVAAGQTTSHVGAFARHGSLRIVTSPALPATVSVDGVPRNDWGMWQSMPPGTYTVSFEPVAGYVGPASQTVTVVAGSLATVTGTYTLSGAAHASPLGAALGAEGEARGGSPWTPAARPVPGGRP